MGTTEYAHSCEVAAFSFWMPPSAFGPVPVVGSRPRTAAVLQAEVAKGFPVSAGRLKGIRQVLKEHVRRVRRRLWSISVMDDTGKNCCERKIPSWRMPPA